MYMPMYVLYKHYKHDALYDTIIICKYIYEQLVGHIMISITSYRSGDIIVNIDVSDFTQ